MLRRSGTAAAIGLYLLLTIVLTWPLARGLTRDLPADLGDPLLNCWTLAWDADHLIRIAGGDFGALRDYWHANIFYPHPLALAYSEHLTMQAVMILPVYAVSGNPILCYNLVFLATFVTSAVGMFLFVRDLTGSESAAFLAGLAYGFAPYRFGTLPHLQVLSSMWIPFVLLGFHRFFESGQLRALALGTAAWIAQNLSCGYYLLFFSPLVLFYVGWEVTRRHLWVNGRVLFPVASAMVLVAIVTGVFLVPYIRLRQLGFQSRSLVETARFSADVYAYLTADEHLQLWGPLVRAWPAAEGALFPGFTTVLLALAAIVARWRRARSVAPTKGSADSMALATALAITSVVAVAMLLGWTLHVTIAGIELKSTRLGRVIVLLLVLAAAFLGRSKPARRTARDWLSSPVGILATLTLLAAAMSFGPQIHARGKLIEERNIYMLFYDHVPGFDGLRVPARFGMLVAAGLSALAGVGAAGLARRRHGIAAITVASAFIVAESWAAPIPINVNTTDYKQRDLVPLPGTVALGSATPPLYRFIAQLPPTSALIELPLGEVAFEARYMFYSIAHWRPLVNGYSGGAPRDYGLLSQRLEDFEDRPAAAWQAVLESRATHIVVHEASYAGDRGVRVSTWAHMHGGKEVAAFGSDRVFLVPSQSAR